MCALCTETPMSVCPGTPNNVKKSIISEITVGAFASLATLEQGLRLLNESVVMLENKHGR